MLLALAQSPFLASQVKVLTHRCHLPLSDGMGPARLYGLESSRSRRAATLHEAARTDRQGAMYVLTRRDPDLAYNDRYSMPTTLVRSVEPVFTFSAEAST